jgi:hypothetical protein
VPRKIGRRLPTFQHHEEVAFLIGTAVVMYYAKWPILVIAAIVGFVCGWLWLCERNPKTMWFVFGFLAPLMLDGRGLCFLARR